MFETISKTPKKPELHIVRFDSIEYNIQTNAAAE